MNAHVKNEFVVQASRLPEEVETISTQVAGEFEVPALEALFLPEPSTIENEEVFVRTMLVVDDLPVNRKLIAVQLKKLGFEVEQAENGQSAVDLVSRNDYAIVFMDLEMPVLDGYQAAIAIRQIDLDRAQHTPIIGMSSSPKESERQKSFNSGMDEYIAKGTSARQLELLIKAHPQRKSSRTSRKTTARISTDVGISIDFDVLQDTHGPYEAEGIIDIAIGTMKTFLSCLQCAFEERNTENILHFSQAMEQPCSMLGLNSMTRLAARVAADALNGDWQRSTEGMVLLQAQYDQILDQITGHIACMHRPGAQ